MSLPLTVVGIAGSLRKASHSKIVLRALRGMFPADTHFTELEIGDFPLYNQDLDGPDKPAVITRSEHLVASSDMVLIVLPEYNHGMPGVLKNAIDWMSRPAYHSCFREKPVMFATLSGGALGGVRAQAQMRETLASMLCRAVPMTEIVITHVQHKMDENGLADPTTLAFLRTQVQHFIDDVRHAAAMAG